jgi:hypothetical protein
LLGPNPDPAGCGFGCGKYDDPSPNQPPEIVPNSSVVECTDNGASNLCAFPVIFNDEQPGFLSVDLGGSFYFSSCFEDSRSSADRELTVLTTCQIPPGSGGTTQILDTFANDGVFSDFGTVTLNINTATGDIPTIAPFDDPVTAAEEAPFSVPINVTGGATPIEISAIALPDWCFVTNTAANCIAPEGSARLFEPYNSFIKATDADGDISFAKLRLAIAQKNTVPELGDVPDFNARFGTNVIIPIDLTDSDGDFINFYPNPPDNIEAVITGPAATYCSVFYSDTGQPERSLQLSCFFPLDSGSFDGTITVTDSGVPPLTAQKNFTVTAVDQSFNTAPQCQNVETTVRPEDTVIIPIESFDAEIDAVSYTETAGNASCSFTDNGDNTATYSCGAPLPLGTLSSNFTATDTLGASCNASISVTVSDDPGNLPPVAVDDDLGAIIVQAVDGNLNNILDNDSDPEGEILGLENVTVVTQPSVGTIEQSPFESEGFALSYDGPLSSDTLSFEYTVADSEGAVSNVATATFEPSGFVSASQLTANGVPVSFGANIFAFEPGTGEITPLGTIDNWGQTPLQPVFATNYSGTPAQLFYAQLSAQELIEDGLDVDDEQAWAVTRASDPDEPRRCMAYWYYDAETLQNLLRTCCN